MQRALFESPIYFSRGDGKKYRRAFRRNHRDLGRALFAPNVDRPAQWPNYCQPVRFDSDYGTLLLFHISEGLLPVRQPRSAGSPRPNRWRGNQITAV